jgi:uncharacterized membrane protein YbhN (UPF0104 family)
MTSSRKRPWLVVAQLAAFALVLWFLGRQAQQYWGDIRALRVTWAWGPLVAASVLTAAMYLMLVATWQHSIGWWGQSFTWRDAARIWFASNLARFVPGGVWQFAGIAAMAASRGVSAVAANGAAILQQVVIIVSGFALTLFTSPELLGPAVQRVIPSGLAPLVGSSVLVAFIWLFPRSATALAARAERMAGAAVRWPAPPVRAFAAHAGLMLVMWLVYGVAFWLFGRALFGADGPGLAASVAIYTAAYVAGIVAVVAPGGLGVREAALTAALTPVIGGERALVMALASRVWLLAVEVVTAGLVLVFVRPSPKGSPAASPIAPT